MTHTPSFEGNLVHSSIPPREIPAAPFTSQATRRILFVSNPLGESSQAETTRRQTLEKLRTEAALLGADWQVERIATGQVGPSLRNSRRDDNVLVIHDASGGLGTSLAERRAGLQGVANALNFSDRSKCEGKTAFVVTGADPSDERFIAAEDLVQQVEVSDASAGDLIQPEILLPKSRDLFPNCINTRPRMSVRNLPLGLVKDQPGVLLAAFDKLLSL